MTTDITELAQMKGQKVEAPYYLAECTECGKMYPSSQLIESRNYMDGDADCYCPHCNATDPDIADCGSEGVTAWNYQQARIDALVEALEKAQRANAAQDDHINQQQDRIDQLEKGHQEAAKQINSWRRMAKQNIAEREKDIAELDAARQRIAELESRTVKLPLPRRKTADDYVDDTFEPCDLAAVYNACRLECEVKFKNALTAVGIKWEAE